MDPIRTRNPATGLERAVYARFEPARVDVVLAQASSCHREGRHGGVDDRVHLLRALADRLDQQAEDLARLMAEEMGKPVKEGAAEAGKCALACRYYADHGPAFLDPRRVKTAWSRAEVHLRPLGPLLAIMPWNFPFWQVIRCAAPAILAGNPVLLKHADNTTGCALRLEQLFQEIGAPAGILQTLLIDHDQAADVIADPRVAAVTLTGSTRAGRAVGEIAGRALKKVVLELGGSDAYVVLADAEVARAAELCVQSRMINNGQSCIAAKRFIVVPEVRESFTDAVVAALSAYTPGDPLDPATRLGPLAREDLRATLNDQVQHSLAAGARLRLGGSMPDGPGAFYPATLLDDVQPGMPAAEEELFGPAAAILPARDEDHALDLANATPFGLGAALFSRDTDRAWRLARDRIRAGTVAVNDFVRSDPRLPFGGIGASGHGRELAEEGLREFMNIKTLVQG